MPCRFASSGTVATSRSASRAILALNVASNFLRDLVISVLHRLRQSRTLHTLTFGPISGVHFKHPFDAGAGGVSLSFPGVDFAAEPVWVVDSAVEALAAQHADLDLDHVEPTGVLGSVVELQAAQNSPGFGGCEGLIEGAG